jgi:hypothetical protein
MGHIPDNWTCKLNLKLLGLVELLLCARDFQGNFELEHSASKLTIFQGTCIPIQIPQVLLQVVIASPCSNHLFPPDNYFSQYILCSTSRIMGHLLPTQLHMKRFISCFHELWICSVHLSHGVHEFNLEHRCSSWHESNI